MTTTKTATPESADAHLASIASTKYAAIDAALVRFQGRSLVSGTEVVDFLLDLRGVVDIEMQLERIQSEE